MAARYRLTLTWTDPVDRAEVEHMAEDCTKNGDCPADEYEVECLDDEDEDEDEE